MNEIDYFKDFILYSGDVVTDVTTYMSKKILVDSSYIFIENLLFSLSSFIFSVRFGLPCAGLKGKPCNQTLFVLNAISALLKKSLAYRGAEHRTVNITFSRFTPEVAVIRSQ
jgi:restriction endonuclease S subunit